MPSKKDHKKSCVYPCPRGCREASLFVKDPQTLASIREGGLEGYDIVYIADNTEKHVFIFGDANGLPGGEGLDLKAAAHEKAHEEALEGKVVTYEWSLEKDGNTCYFQSTLIPLTDGKKKVGSMLGLVKDITGWPRDLVHPTVLKDSTGRTFSQILLAAREEEKKQISSALHDEIGSAAVILTSLLSMVKESVQAGDKQQALKDISKLDEQIKDCVERVKTIIVSLRPPALESVGLVGAVRELLENASRYSGLKHKFVFEEDDDVGLSDNVKITLYRVVQESLNNILKHSQAKTVKVSLKRGKDTVLLKISDDGVGFNIPRQRSIKNVGLLSMRDSVAYLGGEFRIKSEIGKGTTIEVTCPKVVYGGKQ